MVSRRYRQVGFECLHSPSGWLHPNTPKRFRIPLKHAKSHFPRSQPANAAGPRNNPPSLPFTNALPLIQPKHTLEIKPPIPVPGRIVVTKTQAFLGPDLCRRPLDALFILPAMFIASTPPPVTSTVKISKYKCAIVPKIKTRNQPDSSELVPDPFTDETSVWVGSGACDGCGLAFLRSACW